MLWVVCALSMANVTPPSIPDLVSQVDAKRLRATVEKLASFQTRNTLSETLNDAAKWLQGEYRSIPGIQSTLFEYVLPKSRRVPEDKKVVEVVAWLNGSGSKAKSLEELRGQRVILIGGHMDSLNLQVDAATGRAPGANDDASGTSAALECARLMAKAQWSQTVVFVGFSGEEQGLNGSRALAKFAKANGWLLEAVLSNDMVGNSGNNAGQIDKKHVRVFSDEVEINNSRELARFIELSVRRHVKGFGVKLVYRADRFGRGGDHTPFSQEGFSAVRFIEVHEEYTRQHTPDDLPKFMDWTYLANSTKANLAALCELANAGSSPTNVRITRDQSHDTTITWKGVAGTKFVVYWRSTTSPIWEGTISVGASEKITITKVNKDDHFFAVGTEGGIPIAAN
jgi:Zn-dependent M28 family amino/carboxypeptidase